METSVLNTLKRYVESSLVNQPIWRLWPLQRIAIVYFLNILSDFYFFFFLKCVFIEIRSVNSNILPNFCGILLCCGDVFEFFFFFFVRQCMFSHQIELNGIISTYSHFMHGNFFNTRWLSLRPTSYERNSLYYRAPTVLVS